MTDLRANRTVYVTGRTLPGMLHDLVTRIKGDDPFQRVTVVTPGYFSSFYLRRWIAGRNLLNVEFARIEDVADILAEKAASPLEGRPMGRLEGAELVRAAMRECIGAGGLPGPFQLLGDHPSLLTSLQRTLRTLEAEANSDAIDFESLQRESRLDELTAAVGRVWHAYRRLKSGRRLYDRSQVSERAVEALQQHALGLPEMRLRVGAVIVLAASAPASQYRQLWRTLSAADGSHTIAMLTGDGRADALMLDMFGLPAGNPATSDDPIPVPGVVSAADMRSEIRATVRRIVDNAQAQIPLNRQAVLFGDSTYAGRVRVALRLAGIPVSGPDEKSLLSTPAGRFIEGLLAVAETRLARQPTGDWLATCAVRNPVDRQRVSGVEWDRISRAARVHEGADSWDVRLSAYASSLLRRAERLEHHGDDAEHSEDATRLAGSLRLESGRARTLQQFISTLASELDGAEGNSSWISRCGWLKNLLDRFFAVGGETRETADRIEQALEQVAQLDQLGFDPPDFDHFKSTLLRYLSDTRGGGSHLGDGVFVGRVTDAAAVRFDHVHIVGMADGMFPSPDSPDPLLDDSARELLGERFGLELPIADTRFRSRRHQFLSALGGGTSATLSWSRSSGPGRADAGPAQWLTEQVRRRPGLDQVNASDLVRRPESISGVSVADNGVHFEPTDGHERDVWSVRRHVASLPASAAHWLQADGKTGVQSALDLEAGRYGQALSGWSGDLSAASELVPELSAGTLSASRIETFARCPVRYMFGYVLAIEPRRKEDTSFHIPPDRRGTFVHSVLETYLNLRIADGRSQGRETLDEAFLLEKTKLEQEAPELAGPVWEMDASNILRRLRLWVIAEARYEADGLNPNDAELAFGREDIRRDREPEPPIEITLSDGSVFRFAGVIDRVDQRSDGTFFVADYKSGGSRTYNEITKDPVDRGLHLQLALYSNAVRQLRSGGREAASATYWFVLEPGHPLRPSPEQFDPTAAESRLHDVLEALNRTNRAGHFPPRPGTAQNHLEGFENCNYCEYTRLCPTRALRGQMQAAHSTDPRLAPYFMLAGGAAGFEEDGE